MMERLIERGDEIARRAQDQETQRVAQKLRTMFGSGAVDVLEAQVLVRGLALIKRWLRDPSLRFLMGELK